MMITEKHGSTGQVYYEIAGSIDESADFSPLSRNEDTGKLHLDLYGVKRINSVGIKKWITFFDLFRKMKIEMYFYRVSPAIVEQMVNISNFRCGAQVMSVVLPFVCRECHQPSFLIKTKKEYDGVDLTSVSWPCNHCGKTKLVFDDFPDEYLRFWT